MKQAVQKNAAVVVSPQTYAAYQGGPMFFPAVVTNAEAMFAGGLATPSVTAGRTVHSVPVTYATPTANVRPNSLPFAITPQAIVP